MFTRLFKIKIEVIRRFGSLASTLSALDLSGYLLLSSLTLTWLREVMAVSELEHSPERATRMASMTSWDPMDNKQHSPVYSVDNYRFGYLLLQRQGEIRNFFCQSLTDKVSTCILCSSGMVSMDLNIEQMKELIDLFEGSNLSEINVQQDEFQVTLKKNSAGEPRLHSGGVDTQDVTPERSSGGAAGVKKEGEGSDTGQQETDQQVQDADQQIEGKSKEKESITSPIVGTFYRSPSPEEPAYVEVGDRVEEGDTVCIVEAMKVMNEVKAEQGGEVMEICVEDGDSVEYGQDLFKLASREGS